MRIYSTVSKKSLDLGQYAEYCMYYYGQWLLEKFENQPLGAREGHRLARTVSGAAREMKVSFRIGRQVRFRDQVYGPAGVSSSLVPVLSLEHVNFRAPLEERPFLMCGSLFSAPVPETVEDLFAKILKKQDEKAQQRADNFRAGVLKMFLREEADHVPPPGDGFHYPTVRPPFAIHPGRGPVGVDVHPAHVGSRERNPVEGAGDSVEGAVLPDGPPQVAVLPHPGGPRPGE